MAVRGEFVDLSGDPRGDDGLHLSEIYASAGRTEYRTAGVFKLS